jgi:hypothetical protein
MQPTTWNPSDKSADITLSGSNLIATETALSWNWNSGRSVFGSATGKWYWEITISGATQSYWQVGIGDSGVGLNVEPGSDADGYAYRSMGAGVGTGSKGNNNSYVAYGDGFSAGDVVGIALDLDDGKIWFSLNGVWQESGDPAAGTNECFSGISGTFYAMCCMYRGDAETANFGASAFAHSVPTGFASGFGSVYEIGVTNPSMTAEGFTGIYSALSIPMIEAEGFTGITAESSIPMPTIIMTGSDNMTHIESFLTIPSMTAEITQAEQIWGAASIPMMTAAITERETVLGNVSIPMMTAGLSAGAHADLEVMAPAMTAEGTFGAKCEVTLPMMTVEMEGMVGRVIRSSIKLPMMTVEMAGRVEHLVTCDVSIPMMRVDAKLMTGKIITGAVTLPMMTAVLAGYADIDGDIDASVPMMMAYLEGRTERAVCTVLRYNDSQDILGDITAEIPMMTASITEV